MKKRLLSLLLTACMVLSILPVGALAVETTPEMIPVEMTVGDTKQLDAPAGTLYYSTGPTVVTVSEKTGLVTAVGPGKAQIWAALNGDSMGIWVITVTGTAATDKTPPIMPEKIEVTMAVGETKQLTAEGAYYFSSAQPARAPVDSKTGIVTAKEESKNNNIYATDKNGNTVGHWVITIGSVPQQPAQEVPGETGGETVTEAPKVMFAGPTLKNQATLLGTVAEYQTTFDTMFDENGLRKVTVGFNDGKGKEVGQKVGMVNQSGNFVVQPIYTEIEPYTVHPMFYSEGKRSKWTTEKLVEPVYFVDGLTQAKRDGKMGLLNTRGEEVVPCQYDFVALPSEGISAVYQLKEGKTYYLGYWSLEENREIVAPNKYVTNLHDNYLTEGSKFMRKPSGDGLKFHDFIGGYALVTLDTGDKSKPIIPGTTNYPRLGTLIDMTGKEILSKPYFVANDFGYTTEYAQYPQKGPYLAFYEEKDFSAYRWYGGQLSLAVKAGYATGLVGREGIVLPATYTTGVVTAPGGIDGLVKPAVFQILHERQLVITSKDVEVGKEFGGKDGVVDIKGNVRIPFTHGVGELAYYPSMQYIMDFVSNKAYGVDGKLTDYKPSGNYRDPESPWAKMRPENESAAVAKAIPASVTTSANLDLGLSQTIYVEGNTVYRISANYIDSTYAVKPYAPEKVTAQPSATKLMVDGKNVAVDTYAINGNNYIKLRDLATMVSGTEKSFDVTWDGGKNAINLISGKGYTSVGGEMAKGNGQSQAATRNSAKIFVDGSEVSMTAYTINSNNYFKLRDVMQIFRIGVGYDGATATATLTTAEIYTLTATEQARYDAHVKVYKTVTGKDFPTVTDTIAPPKTSAPGGLLEGGTYKITIDVPAGGYATVTASAGGSTGSLGITDMVGSVPITFTLRHLGNNKYTFQTSKGTFLTSTGGIGSTVSTRPENEEKSQTFIIEKATGGKFRIYNYDWLAWTIRDNDFGTFGINLQRKSGDTYQTFKFTPVNK